MICHDRGSCTVCIPLVKQIKVVPRTVIQECNTKKKHAAS